jgi:hypothetical protein
LREESRKRSTDAVRRKSNFEFKKREKEPNLLRSRHVVKASSKHFVNAKKNLPVDAPSRNSTHSTW